MSFKLFICWILFSSSQSFLAQETTIIEEVVVTDSAYHKEEQFVLTDSIVKSNYSTDNVIYPKKFSPNYKNKYRGNEFDYQVLKPKESIWDKIKRQIAKIFSSVFKDLDPNKANRYTVVVLRVFGIIIIAVLLYLLVRYLLSKDGNFLFGKKNRKINISTNDLEENIHEINFPETILKLEKQEDYRSAIRYQFLFVLKKLSDKNLIDWNPEKTNRDYLTELRNVNLKEELSRVIYIYDYTWYGEFDTKDKDYQRYKSFFDKF